jgi:cytidylate kinase
MAVITISRQFATGGKIFAEKLAKTLDYAFIDKDIYKIVAEKEKISIEELNALESISGMGIDFFQKLIDSDYIKRITGKKDLSFEHNEVVEAVEKTVKEIARNDNVVILGRAGQCILQDEKNVFHIKIVKNFEHRIKFLMEKGITENGAITTVKRKDEERENYIKKFYDKDWNNPELYHLIINLSKVTHEQGIEVIKKLIQS